MSNEELRKQIRNNFELKDTYELLMIWKKNNRVVWSDTAFEILESILKERLGKVLPQDNPIYERDEAIEDDNDFEDWEVKLLDNEDQPELYEATKVLELIRNINKVAIGIIIINVLHGLLNFQFIRALLLGTPMSFAESVQSIPNELGIIFTVGLKILVTYFPLKALNQILRILMEMEFNSRKAKS
ncbi:MAG: hypothetical protein JNM55_03640 [Anaerolineales bacterium]|nr:hypothetical protein [Anaerolineales bacterium]